MVIGLNYYLGLVELYSQAVIRIVWVWFGSGSRRALYLC